MTALIIIMIVILLAALDSKLRDNVKYLLFYEVFIRVVAFCILFSGVIVFVVIKYF